MVTKSTDLRSESRRALDEQIAGQAPLTPLEFPPSAKSAPVEAHLGKIRRPLALAGIVENGLVRPLDPGVSLREHARVIIVTSEES